MILPLRKDAVEPREVALRGPRSIRLRPQYPVYQRAKTCHRPPLHQVIHPLGEVGSIGKIDAGNAADGLCGVGHVTNITWNGGYGDGVTANSEQRTANRKLVQPRKPALSGAKGQAAERIIRPAAIPTQSATTPSTTDAPM